MTQTLRTLAAALALAAGFAGTAHAATVRIGVAGPMTGDQGKQGQDVLNGARLAVDEWNAANPGLKAEIVVGDDQRDPRQAVAVANKFVNDGVVAVVGHWNSSCSIPASTVYADNRLVQVTPASTNPQFTERGLWNVFRVCGRDDQQGKVAADFVASKGLKRIAVLHDKTTYGQGLADAFRDALKKDHRIEPVHYAGVTQGDKDHSAVLTTVRAVAPDLIYFGGIYPEGGLLVKQARDLGIRTRFMSGDGVIDPEFVKIAGKDATEGTWLTFSPEIKNVPEARKTVEAYEKRFGPVGPYSIYAYTAARIVLEGMKAVGFTGPRDSQKLADYIRKTSFATPFGRIAFDAKGDRGGGNYVVYETRGGEFVQITGVAKQAAR